MEEAKEFIRDNWDLIENRDFESLYINSYNKIPSFEIGQVTSLMLSAGINPLDYMNRVPDSFLAHSDIPEFEIPNHIIKIGDYAFYNCTLLKSVKIPNSVTIISYYTFAGTLLESIAIPDLVTEIGDYAFLSCKKLKSIEIPESVTKIGIGVFAYGSDDLVIKCKKDSYADKYAREHGINVEYI